jgi:hypothetical protein
VNCARKKSARQLVWLCIDSENGAKVFLRPAHGRIPNFAARRRVRAQKKTPPLAEEWRR